MRNTISKKQESLLKHANKIMRKMGMRGKKRDDLVEKLILSPLLIVSKKQLQSWIEYERWFLDIKHYNRDQENRSQPRKWS